MLGQLWLFYGRNGGKSPGSAACSPHARNQNLYGVNAWGAVSRKKYQRRLHILHMSTAEEAELLRKDKPAWVTAEVTPQHLLLNTSAYETIGTLAQSYCILNKGLIASGYDADLVLVDLETYRPVARAELQTKCGWSPFEGWNPTGYPVVTIVGDKWYMTTASSTPKSGEERWSLARMRRERDLMWAAGFMAF